EDPGWPPGCRPRGGCAAGAPAHCRRTRGAARLVAGLAVGTGVVGGEERADDELAGLDRGDRAADLLDDAAVLVPHRFRLGDRIDAAVVPQVRPAYAGDRHSDDGVCRLDDRRGVARLETDIARTIENSAPHRFISLS